MWDQLLESTENPNVPLLLIFVESQQIYSAALLWYIFWGGGGDNFLFKTWKSLRICNLVVLHYWGSIQGDFWIPDRESLH